MTVAQTFSASVVLDVLAAVFGRTLRHFGVAASPAEVIEVRRVLGLLGARDLAVLRAALRATCAKYDHEQHGFDLAFESMFRALVESATDEHHSPLGAQVAGGLPTDLDVGADEEAAKYAEYNERAVEIGDLLDAPEADKGFNPHKDDDDISLSSEDHDLSIDTDGDMGRRGVTYTVDLERSGSTAAGELASSTSGAVAGQLNWEDPASILAWFDAYDPSSVYGDGGESGPLSAAMLDRITDAVEAFVAALGDVTGTMSSPVPVDGAAQAIGRHAEIERASHEVLKHMRGTPRPRPREHSRGPLDMRRTVRSSLRTDGIPFRLVTKTPVPGKVRLLVLADVSLSVRPITAFTLRLAQAMHARAHRCTVMGFVDAPVDVTTTLLGSTGDGALAAVLADARLDLEASSDYGRTFTDLLQSHPEVLDKRTAVIIVGDGRCNGRPAGLEALDEIRSKVHRIAWITPEARRYWAQAACSMEDYERICDRVVVARDGEQLTSQAAELGHALS
ncbi:VWA domain-containing protein [Rhodococcus sp. IEGM 1370]|uniref:MadC family VWA domain-containing protein n=1 Tax=Rhodococcus sp. IEGM 1370 TaxID=3082222 RepID=UPI002953B4FD|nr:VWA domain-containing protein [Rhodococcus sp. IEGM 1370]MDV8075393.1 VWA domain-containing protein [Rhodococcus sp. IEGM 1370]